MRAALAKIVSIFLPFALALTTAAEVHAQASPSAHTLAVRYDEMGRVTGTIAPDPDGAGQLKFAAMRTTFDQSGRPVVVEAGELADWQTESVRPKDWTSFTILSIIETEYDSLDRKLKELTKGSDGVGVALTQYSYDNRGRFNCTAVRMNPSVWTSVLPDACLLTTASATGEKDRITKYHYDDAGRLLRIQKALGVVGLEQDYVIYTYNVNGQPKTVKDAKGNLATYSYDSFNRMVAWSFPQKANGAVSASCNIGSISEINGIAGPVDAKGPSDDCEKYSYDRNGNRVRLVKRDGSVIVYGYDNLNRVTFKDIDATNVRTSLALIHKRDVFFGYDNRGLQIYARFDSTTGEGVAAAFDGFDRMQSSTLTMDGATRTLSYTRDKNGNRTELTWMDGAKTSYSYDGLNRMSVLYEGALGSTTNMLTYGYNNRGLRASQTGRYTPLSGFGYDAANRLNSITHDVAGIAGDVTFGLNQYNPANQVTQRSASNDAYVWNGGVNINRGYAVNGLNQYTSAGSAVFSYDDNGNLTNDGANSFVYDVENRLVSRSGATIANLRYDPLGRLYELGGGLNGLTRFLYDGDELVAEFDGNTGLLLRRYLHGLSVDDPVVAYEGAAFNSPRWLLTNHQGSIVAVSDNTGAAISKNTYDEWGIPGSGNASVTAGGRFSYTGQVWLPELGMYYYKARIYSPTLGRFMQTDPIGYDDQMNLYAYVGNDPVNFHDPSGKNAVQVARGVLSFIAFDAATPEPTDAAWPKWAGYALVGGVAALVVANSDDRPKNVAFTIKRHHATYARGEFTSYPTVARQDNRRESYVIRVQVQGSEVGGNKSVVLAQNTAITAAQVEGAMVGLVSQLSRGQQEFAAPAVLGVNSRMASAVAAGGLDAGQQIRGTNSQFSPGQVRIDVEIINGRNIKE